MKIYHVNAFTQTIEKSMGGNPAGVVLNADHLSASEMLAIAAQVGYSETAFISKSHLADFKIRFFTPSDEVDLCGHATIASFYLLKSLGLIAAGDFTQETKAGVLSVKVSESGEVYMQQLVPTAYEIIDKKSIAVSLGISEASITTPPQIYSTGLKDIIIEVASLDIIENLQPDFDLITKISRQYNATGYHVFTLETLHKSTAHCRNFAPLYAIDEEAATGTASGALSGYIIDHQLIKSHKGINHFTFEQGYEMQAPSEIKGQITIKDDKISEVLIGGKGTIL